MHSRSSLSEKQRERLVELFEAGMAGKAASRLLGVGLRATDRLYDRWRLHGRLCLVMKPTKASYSFEVKKEVVARYLAGEKAMDLAAEFGLSSAALIRSWALGWKKYGDEAFEPQRKGRPPGASTSAPLSAEDLLRRENRRLLAENAYLKKLRDLREQGHH